MSLREIQFKKDELNRESAEQLAALSFELEEYLKEQSFTGKEILRASQTFYENTNTTDNSYINGFGVSGYLVKLLSNIIIKREKREKRKQGKEDPIKNRSELIDL